MNLRNDKDIQSLSYSVDPNFRNFAICLTEKRNRESNQNMMNGHELHIEFLNLLQILMMITSKVK